MVFKRVESFEQLKQSFDEQVLLFRGGYSGKPCEKLHEPRRTQLLFLQKIIALVESSAKSDKERVDILSGIFLNVRYEIELEGRSSQLKEYLNTVLGVTPSNLLDPKTAKQLHEAGLAFFETIMTDENGALLLESPFSDLKCFNDRLFVERSHDLIRRDAINAYGKLAATRDATLAANKSQEPSFVESVFSWWGSSSAHTQPKLTIVPVEDEVLVHSDSDDDASTSSQTIA